MVFIKKILIIDDSPVARLLLKKCIGDNFDIYEASSGEQGLDLFQSVNTDLTFLDLTMPGMNGLEVLKEIIEIDSRAKVIIISADRQKSTIREALDAGAFTVLKKPPRRETILQTIHSVEIGKKHDPESLL